MFTNNFNKLMRSMLQQHYNSLYTISGSTTYVDPYGQYFNASYCGRPIDRFRYAYCKASPTYGVYFGTDSTPTKQSDYKLGSVITTGLSITNPTSVTRNEDSVTGVVTYSAVYIVKNSSSEEITIAEIGWYTDVTDGSSSKAHYVMLDRTVLDEPIVIPAGETKYVVYDLKFSLTSLL